MSLKVKDLKDILKRYKYIHGQNIDKKNKHELKKIHRQLIRLHVGQCDYCQKGIYHKCEIGGDLFSNVKGFLSGPRKTAPPVVINFLDKYGRSQIVSMKICRKPINKAIDSLLNLITFGSFQQQKKKYSYDDLFHLYILMDIIDSKGIHHSIKLEKNHVISIKHSEDLGQECIPISGPFPSSVNIFFENGLDYQSSGQFGPSVSKNFFLYDAINNNCQVFITSLIRGNGLATPQTEDFILQDTKQLLPRYASQFARIITDIGASFDRLIHGSSLTFSPSSPMLRKASDGQKLNQKLSY